MQSSYIGGSWDPQKVQETFDNLIDFDFIGKSTKIRYLKNVSVLLYGSETWPLSQEDLYRLKRSDHAMIRWICRVELVQLHSTNDLKFKLRITDLEDITRLMYGHL